MKLSNITALLIAGLIAGCAEPLPTFSPESAASVDADGTTVKWPWRGVEYEREAKMTKGLSYTSATRDWLIRRDKQYNYITDTWRYDFRGLEANFRCPHDPEEIQRISAAGWDLVKCIKERAIFLRKREEPIERLRQCSQQKLIFYDFDVVVVTFDPEWGRKPGESDQRLLTTAFRKEMPLPSSDLEKLAREIFPLGSASYIPSASYTSGMRPPVKYTLASFPTNEQVTFEHPFELETCPLPSAFSTVVGSRRYSLRIMSSDLAAVVREGRSLFPVE